VISTKNETGVYPSAPATIPECKFVGRSDELRLCKAAFGIKDDWTFDDSLAPLHFRLEGPPGVGKNEIVYEIARNLARSMKMPFYMIQGHEEMTPEDLSILIAPDPDANTPLGLRRRASPLATALCVGGLFFFDEINRVPERALTPLASVLDRRCSMYSATTGDVIEPEDDVARARFRFCCALNPAVGRSGAGALPDYIDERTLPAITVDYHDRATLREILQSNVTSDSEVLDAFDRWYQDQRVATISVRQAITLVMYAMRTRPAAGSLPDALGRVARSVLRPEQVQSAADRGAPGR